MTFDLETFLPYRLHQAAERTSQQFQKHYRDTYGMNRTEWRVLLHVGSYGPVSATQIARRSRLDKAVISRAIFKLEQDGLIERRHRPNDRRGHDLALTDRGARVFERLREMAAAFNAELIGLLGDREGRQLLEALHRLERAAGRNNV